MERGKVVLDASVVVKWFVEESYSKEARLLRDTYANGLIDLVAPNLLFYEVINALKYSGGFGEDELKEVIEALKDYQITLYEFSGNIALKAIEVAMRKGITIYDATYVALAYELGTILYTADEKLIRKVKDKNHVKHIMEFKV